MSIYSFGRLIAKYSVSFTLLVSTNDQYDERGIIQRPVDDTKSMVGAIIPADRVPNYRESGMINQTDKLLYTRFPLTDPLDKCRIKYNDETYSLDTVNDYTAYGDFYTYRMKLVSAFD